MNDSRSAGIILTLGQLAEVLDGELVTTDSAAARREARGYAIDSRSVAAGTVFFALAGARTDGHRFLGDVRDAGAAAAVVHREPPYPDDLPCIRVGDTEAALAALGRHLRSHGDLRVVGITGSAGKTTTKEFAATLLATRLRVFKSEGNFNTTIGLPLTLSKRRPDDQVAVLEMGMSYPGELRRVAAIARPDVAVITNVGIAHVGNFETADDVAEAKAEILSEVRPGGTMVANADDPRVMRLAGRFDGPTVTFGIDNPADIRAIGLRPLGTGGTEFTVETSDGSAAATLAVAGRHQVSNALAALGIARALGLDPLELASHVQALQTTPHRGTLHRLRGGVTVLDDCYNANPAAVLAALDALAALDGARHIAILGDMLELGSYAESSHREVGAHAALRADIVIGVGQESAVMVEAATAEGAGIARHAADAAAAAALTLHTVRDGDAVLIKGSRGIGLEAVVEALLADRGR